MDLPRPPFKMGKKLCVSMAQSWFWLIRQIAFNLPTVYIVYYTTRLHEKKHFLLVSHFFTRRLNLYDLVYASFLHTGKLSNCYHFII
jgi:hypothetical protein